MSVLRTIESKLESLFEGVFGRAFRTNVQPVELARKLVKEMDDHRSVSVSRVYVPNEYTIYLSPADREQFADFEESLRDELAGLPHRARAPRALRAADRRRRSSSRPTTTSTSACSASRRASCAARAPPQDAGRAEAAQPAPGRDDDLQGGRAADGRARRPTRRLAGAARDRDADRSTARGTSSSERRVVIGRSKDCDIQLADPNVSRRHAEVRQEGATYWVVDLDSTNGVETKGKRVKRLKLEDGTRFTIGSTEIVFSQELA